MASPLLVPVLGYASKLRFPTLFKIMAALFIIDLVTPDLIPLITFGMPFDELFMGALTLLLASWKNGRQLGDPANAPNAKLPIEGEFKKD